MSQSSETDELLQTIATIFAITVLLDKKQRDQELIEFCHAVSVANRHLRPDVILPRTTILKWYGELKPEVVSRLAGQDAWSWKRELLSRIPNAEIRNLVLASIFTISVCDYELRDEESAFIKLALDTWKTGVPLSADLATAAF